MKVETRIKIYEVFLSPKMKKLVDCLSFEFYRKRGITYIGKKAGYGAGYNSKIFKKLEKEGLIRCRKIGRRKIVEVVE